MPPLAQDLWPDDIKSAFAAVNRARCAGDAAGMARGCRAAETVLTALAAGAPPRPLRVQIARSYFDLASVYYELGRPAAGRRAVGRSRRLWERVAADEPADFYARTQLAGCLNWLALMASDAGDSAAAERLHLAALAVRTEAHRRAAAGGGPDDPTDRLDNLTHRAGVLCNLGHLLRERGDGKRASAYYAEAIRELEGLLPKYPRKRDRQAGEGAADDWEARYGQPHYSRVAARFLDNARWGRGQLKT